MINEYPHFSLNHLNPLKHYPNTPTHKLDQNYQASFVKIPKNGLKLLARDLDQNSIINIVNFIGSHLLIMH